MMRTLQRQKLRGLHRLPYRRNTAGTQVPAAFRGSPIKWKDALSGDKGLIKRVLLGFRKSLIDEGIPESELPSVAAVESHAEREAVVFASAQHADLAEQAQAASPVEEVADGILGFSEGGIFEQAVADKRVKSIVQAARGGLVSRLKDRRKIAEETRGQSAPSTASRIAAEVSGAQKAAMQAELDALTEQIEAAKAAEKPAEVAVAISRDDVRQMAEAIKQEEASRRGGGRRRRSAPEEVVVVSEEVKEGEGGESEEISRFTGVVSKKGTRLGGYLDKLARVRHRVELDPKLAAETRRDILLYVLKDGTTQVWIKGALTETFQRAPRQGQSSWGAAKGYAVQWLEKVGEAGTIKKSRMDTRIVFSTEEEPDRMRVVQESYTTRRAAARKALPSFDTVYEQLTGGKKPNPSVRQLPFRNPVSEAIANELEASLRRRTNGLGTLLGIAGGFVAGTYAEASFGLSKQFTRGGKATVKGAQEVARAAQERRLPTLPKMPAKAKVKTVKDFTPSARLDKMIRDFYAYESKKKAVPFSEAKKREQMEARLDDMWDEIEALREQERAAQGIRSNSRWNSATRSTFAPVKATVPAHIPQTPRKAGERISAIGVKGEWPIGDLFHARLAATYIMSPSHAANRAKVLRALEAHWPQYDWRGFLAEGEPARLLRDWKRHGLITVGEYNDGLLEIQKGRGEAYIAWLRRQVAG